MSLSLCTHTHTQEHTFPDRHSICTLIHRSLCTHYRSVLWFSVLRGIGHHCYIYLYNGHSPHKYSIAHLSRCAQHSCCCGIVWAPSKAQCVSAAITPPTATTNSYSMQLSVHNICLGLCVSVCAQNATTRQWYLYEGVGLLCAAITHTGAIPFICAIQDNSFHAALQ